MGNSLERAPHHHRILIMSAPSAACLLPTHPRLVILRSLTKFYALPGLRLAAHLLERKILIRNCGAWPGVVEEAIRIAVRTPAENERLLTAWEEFPCV